MDSSLDIAALVRAELPHVMRLARRLRAPASHVEDVAQEVFLLLYRRHRDGGVPASEVRTLLRAATFWTTCDLRKKLRYRAHPSLDQGDFEPEDRCPDVEQSASDAEQVDRAYAILHSLPDDLRDVFVLHEIEEMTLEEIAAATGTSRNTIASRLTRAREAFDKAVRRRTAEERRKYQIAGAFVLPLSDELLRAMRAEPGSALPGAEDRVLAGVRRGSGAAPNLPRWPLRAMPSKAFTFAAGVAVGLAAAGGLRCGISSPARAEPAAMLAPPVAVAVASSALPSFTSSTASLVTASASSVAAPGATASASTPHQALSTVDTDADTRCYQKALACLNGDPREAIRLLTLCDQQYPTTLHQQRARLRREAESLVQQRGQ